MSKRQKSSTVRVILSDEAKEQEQLALRTCQEARKKWINSTHLEELEEVMETGTGSAVHILHKFNQANKHKMDPIPTFTL